MSERVWSEKDLVRRAKRRLAVLQHAEEVSGDGAGPRRRCVRVFAGVDSVTGRRGGRIGGSVVPVLVGVVGVVGGATPLMPRGLRGWGADRRLLPSSVGRAGWLRARRVNSATSGPVPPRRRSTARPMCGDRCRSAQDSYRRTDALSPAGLGSSANPVRLSVCRAGRSVTGGCDMAPDWGLPSVGRDRQSVVDRDRSAGGQPADVEGWESARAVADAVLYEGYLLYPYRKSSAKNRVRWQFGVLAPRGWVEARPPVKATVAGSADAWRQRTECLFEASPRARLRVRLRFLQPQHRSVQRSTADGEFVEVDELEIGGERYLTFDEAVPREFDVAVALAELGEREHVEPIALPGGEEIEQLGGTAAGVRGRIVRTRSPLSARLRLSTADAAAPFPLHRLRVLVENTVSDQARRRAACRGPPPLPCRRALRVGAAGREVLVAVGSAQVGFGGRGELPQPAHVPRVGGRRGQAGRDAVVPDHHVRPPRRGARKPR